MCWGCGGGGRCEHIARMGSAIILREWEATASMACEKGGDKRNLAVLEDSEHGLREGSDDF